MKVLAALLIFALWAPRVDACPLLMAVDSIKRAEAAFEYNSIVILGLADAVESDADTQIVRFKVVQTLKGSPRKQVIAQLNAWCGLSVEQGQLILLFARGTGSTFQGEIATPEVRDQILQRMGGSDRA